MDALLLISLFFAAVLGSVLLYALLYPVGENDENCVLSPFSVLPVPDGEPSTRAFLERLAGQIAWMDSSVMQTLILIHLDSDTEAAALCEDISRQYDFISCMSLSQAQNFLANRLKNAKT